MGEYSNLMRAAIHLGEWLAENDIDPAHVEITLKPKDWGIKGAIDHAVNRDGQIGRAMFVTAGENGRRDRLEVCGLAINIPPPLNRRV